MDGDFLQHYLGPLAGWLEDADVNEIALNPDGRIWIERAGHGAMTRTDTVLDGESAMRLARQLAGQADQRLSPDNPIASAKLALDGDAVLRVHIVQAPVVEGVAISLRRIRLKRFSIDDLEDIGAFASVETEQTDKDAPLRKLLDENRIRHFLRAATRARKNILVSGGTSTGKTTVLRALLGEADEQERIVTIEDARELHPEQPNSVQLLASRRQDQAGKTDAASLLESALRMRPDRIILGELRGSEAYAFLEAINTGHPGSLTSIHADSPSLAFERLSLMVMRATQALKKSEVLDYAHSIIDIVLQLGRSKEGDRRVTSILFEPRA